MMLDMVKVITLNKPGQCLSSAYDIVKDNGPGRDGYIWRVKSLQGFPVDFRIFDDAWIYDTTTEYDKNGWFDPTNLKIASSVESPKGCRMMPRYITAGFPFADVVSTNRYMVMNKGQYDFVSHSVGTVRYSMSSPFMQVWGGDVFTKVAGDAVLTYKLCYQWGGASGLYTDLEEYCFAPPFGLVRWQHFTLNKNTGVYDMKDDPGVKNKLFPLPLVPKLVFPIMTGQPLA